MTAAASAREDAIYETLKWRLIPVLMLCYVTSYLDRVNIGFAKLQMLGDLHFSETTYGLGAGIFFLGYVLCGVPSNLILHRVGAKAWIALQTKPQDAPEYSSLFWSFEQTYRLVREEPMERSEEHTSELQSP